MSNDSYQSNNLDLLRLVLASSVVILHMSHLTALPEIIEIANAVDWLSSRAVTSFFIVSGFLIALSFERSKNLKSYFINRILRLYPAYLFLIVFCACLLFFVSEVSFNDYFRSDFIRYIFYNLFFLNFVQPTLPGVFSNNIIPIVNGSLWTLKIEVLFYLFLPVLYYFIKGKSNRWISVFFIFLYVASFAYTELLIFLSDKFDKQSLIVLSHQLPGQLAYFVSGIAAYKFIDKVRKYYCALFILTLICFGLNVSFLEPLAQMTVICFLFIFTKKLFDYSRIGDISYGVYIFHFPIIQLFVYFNLNDYIGPYLFVVAVYFTVYFISYLSWWFVEKPSLSLKYKFSKLT
ncbi:acyltransferase [Shewanella sp. FJAT-51649]|uniref:acyltransferase family protein n=1 Tax=Shewanella sp. FJAT-51649 TaxID=2864210 RepID=UPI001C65BF69|nr:acyltransferase [Shewanella sp. FJAT-51649]QYJ72801.1 acyltransferase [Shewanella sp. FJAT-51649]